VRGTENRRARPKHGRPETHRLWLQAWGRPPAACVRAACAWVLRTGGARLQPVCPRPVPGCCVLEARGHHTRAVHAATRQSHARGCAARGRERRAQAVARRARCVNLQPHLRARGSSLADTGPRTRGGGRSSRPQAGRSGRRANQVQRASEGGLARVTSSADKKGGTSEDACAGGAARGRPRRGRCPSSRAGQTQTKEDITESLRPCSTGGPGAGCCRLRWARRDAARVGNACGDCGHANG
jgi:hypothetical protein